MLKYIYSIKYKEFIIFITGGGIGALVKWVLTFIMTSIIGIHYLIAYAVAEIVNIIINFAWHTIITFKVTDKTYDRLIRFSILSCTTFFLNFTLVYLFKEYVIDRLITIIIWGKDLNYLVAVIVITFLVAFLNYSISKIWVFNK